VNAAAPRIAGVDEVGRGALAGPVVAAAVILDPAASRNYPDSKKLSAAKRLAACQHLFDGDALAIGLGWSMPQEIDRINILQATLLAMRRALANMGRAPDAVLVDGNINPASGFLEKSVVKADDLFPCVGAASIVAKVFRDQWMVQLDSDYPEYGFAGHKGYGAATHMQAIQRLGGCPWHRQSFAPLRQPALF